MYYIFLESLGKIKFNEDDHNDHDHHQEPQQKNEEPYLSKGHMPSVGGQIRSA